MAIRCYYDMDNTTEAKPPRTYESAQSMAPAAGKGPDIPTRRAEYAGLIAEHEAVLLRVARRLCNGLEESAQDLVQETLVKGYQAYVEGRFAAGTNARAWLLRILTNSFLTDRRRKDRWEAGVSVQNLTHQGEVLPVSLQAAPQDRPDVALMTGTLDEPLERALAALTEEMRICVVLVDIEGWEYVEAATALAIPVGTVRSRLSRARLLLHSLLYDYAHERRRA